MATISAHRLFSLAPAPTAQAAEKPFESLPAEDDWVELDGPDLPAAEDEGAWLVELLTRDLMSEDEIGFDADACDVELRQDVPPRSVRSAPRPPQDGPAGRLYAAVSGGAAGKQLTLTTAGLTHVDVYLDDEPLGSVMVCDDGPASETFVGVADGTVLELWGFADDELVTSRRICA